MKKIRIDNRWDGTGGIGTFASEINKIAKFEDAGFLGNPVSPLDSLKTSVKLISDDSDVIFFPGYIPPIASKIPYVFTIHDLNHIDRPENTSFIKKVFYNTVIKHGCKKANYIFTVSEFSRNRIIDWSGVSPTKVINVGNGVSERFKPEGDKKDFGFEYILCVSNRKEHKNELRTIDAYKLANFDQSLKLVLTGKSNSETTEYIKKLGLEEHVKFTGYVKDEEFPALYRGAKAVVFVSLYEGFGLPVIESMASGVPVITSNTTSLVEISGDAALKVNPESTQEIKEGLIRISTDNDYREYLISAGLEQAKKFTWERVIKKVYHYLNM